MVLRHCNAPIRHHATGISRKNISKGFLCLIVPKRMKQRIGAVELLLRSRTARNSKIDLPEFFVSPVLVLVMLLLSVSRAAESGRQNKK